MTQETAKTIESAEWRGRQSSPDTRPATLNFMSRVKQENPNDMWTIHYNLSRGEFGVVETWYLLHTTGSMWLLSPSTREHARKAAKLFNRIDRNPL